MHNTNTRYRRTPEAVFKLSLSKMSRSSDDFYLSRKEPNKSCLLALRKILLDVDAEVSETVKYGMPCFCYKNKSFCYLWEDK